MKKLIFLICMIAISYGQTVTNGGFETNVFNRNTGERIYTEYYDEKQVRIKMIRTVKGRMNHGPYKDFYESGACANLNNKYIYLCFSESNNESRLCRFSLGPQEVFHKVSESIDMHSKTSIAAPLDRDS